MRAALYSGAALHAALLIAARTESERKVVVVIPDTGERYITTPLFHDEEKDGHQ